MNEEDSEEFRRNGGTVENSATVRAVLALRDVVYSNGTATQRTRLAHHRHV